MIKIRLRDAMRNYSERRGVKITYQQLSEVTGISKATLETLGSRANYNTTLAVLDTLCRHLDCDLSDLVTYTKD